MRRTVLTCFLIAVCLTITAEPVVSSPEENRSQYSNAAALNMNKPVREGALLQLADYVKHGDTLLKQRLQDSYSDLKEQLKQADELLKERVLEGESQIKEQLKDGDSRMKEELDEDVAWLKNRVNKEQDRIKEDLKEDENKLSEGMMQQKKAFADLQDSVKKWTESTSASIDDLKQQVTDLREDLSSTKHLLQSTQTELAESQQALKAAQEKMAIVEEDLQRTRGELNARLQAAQQEVSSLRVQVDSLQTGRPRPALPGSLETGDEYLGDTASTFTRWGRTTCPGNTSLVYSGVAGGSWYDHPGGASNYLCLVMDPQLDNKTAVPSLVNYLYGAEYEEIQGHHDQDAVCSVCRAPQATTLMIPATLTCPAGWTTQYKGHLMSAYHNHQGRTEYVCMDEISENSHGGHVNSNGALFYHVVSQCGSLPCPPYVNNLITTCVVCSQ